MGVSQARKECVSYAKVGINSAQWNAQFINKVVPTKTMIISLGANDLKVDTEKHIRLLRNKVKADRVFWLLPNERRKPEQVEIVKRVAAEFGDSVIPRPEKDISMDGIHPTYKGYKILGDLTK